MSKVILKDKKDLNTLRLNGWKKEGYEIVGSQDEIKRDINVEILSVKLLEHSKIVIFSFLFDKFHFVVSIY